MAPTTKDPKEDRKDVNGISLKPQKLGFLDASRLRAALLLDGILGRRNRLKDLRPGAVATISPLSDQSKDLGAGLEPRKDAPPSLIDPLHSTGVTIVPRKPSEELNLLKILKFNPPPAGLRISFNPTTFNDVLISSPIKVHVHMSTGGKKVTGVSKDYGEYSVITLGQTFIVLNVGMYSGPARFCTENIELNRNGPKPPPPIERMDESVRLARIEVFKRECRESTNPDVQAFVAANPDMFKPTGTTPQSEPGRGV